MLSGANDAAEEGQKKANIETEKMAASLNEKIAKSKSVEQIEILTSNIIEITEQTNLLALNASIEAARAGKQDAALRWLRMRSESWQVILRMPQQKSAR